MLAGVLACLVGAGLVAFTHIHYFPVVDRMIWETSPEENQRMAYHEFNDTTNALMSAVCISTPSGTWGGCSSPKTP